MLIEELREGYNKVVIPQLTGLPVSYSEGTFTCYINLKAGQPVEKGHLHHLFIIKYGK